MLTVEEASLFDLLNKLGVMKDTIKEKVYQLKANGVTLSILKEMALDSNQNWFKETCQIAGLTTGEIYRLQKLIKGQ